MKTLSDVNHPTRKKLFWLILLIPILYVVVDNLIYPIDESKILRRTTYEEAAPAPEVEEGEEPSIPSADDAEEVESLSGWEIYDMVWVRVEKAWPLVMSLMAFIFRKKLVGDPK
jgi:hypothetical protein